MELNINSLSRNYFSKGKPCPYKLKSGIEILIYPILVRDCELYDDCKTILELDKRNINDEKIIQMSQLAFLDYTFHQDIIIDEQTQTTMGYNELQKFKGIFSLCLHEDYVAVTQDNNGKFIVLVADKKDESNGENEDDFIIKYTISNKDYINISKIILFQNDANYDDEYISPDVLKEYNAMMEIKMKGINAPTLERRKIFVLSRYRCSLEEIENMTYRMFELLYNEYLDIEQYYVDNMYKTAYKFDIKENISYPLFRPKKDKFKDLFMNKESLNNKLGN